MAEGSLSGIPSPCFRAWECNEALDTAQTTEKHEPFQQCCNTVSFWFKHTHTLTNAKCTHYQILRSAFPRTTGESFNAVNPRGCPNHPHFVSKWLISHFVFAHWQCPLCCSSAVDSQVLCSHSFFFFFFQTEPLISLCLSGGCRYNTDICLLALYSL